MKSDIWARLVMLAVDGDFSRYLPETPFSHEIEIEGMMKSATIVAVRPVKTV